MSEWEPVPERSIRFQRSKHPEVAISEHDEAAWLKEVYKINNRGGNSCKQLDLLEVYAYPNSVLTETAIAAGLHAKRFTKEDGDLDTHAGRIKLLSWIVLYRPKHVWMAPECAPWCAWSRFNASRSLQSFDRIQQSQQVAQVHLKLCNLISKLQVSENRHAHLENPWTSALWSQRAVEEFLKASLPARLDQCMFGLKHPESHDPMEKKTRIQTTSREMWKELDQRTCLHEHAHAHISGQCTIPRTQHAGIQVCRFFILGVLPKQS